MRHRGGVVHKRQRKGGEIMKEYHAAANKKRVFSFISRFSISFFHMLVFGYVWLFYYNLHVFRAHRILGGVVSLFIYFLLYDRLARLYKAYKVGHYSIGETLFSQLLAFGITDLIFYVECCLISRGYVLITPGAIAVAAQFLGTIIWAIAAKRYCMHHIPARKTLIIFGENGVDRFIAKIEEKYKHLFQIETVLPASEKNEILFHAADKADSIILYQLSTEKKEALMQFCVDEAKTFYITPSISDIIAEGFENRHIIDSPLLKYDSVKNPLSWMILKRSMDIAGSFLGILITLPITLLTAAAIKLEDGGKIFYKQKRYTKDWKTFEILKFRSMVMDAEKNGALLCGQNDKRITKVGSFIRRFRIDELPQLVNVLKGEMSLVGPRPERVENMEQYTRELPQFSYRLRVKSGLTGYAQLYGKYNTSAGDKLLLDLIYIENQSFFMDMKLIMLTFKILFIPESTEGFDEKTVRTMNREQVLAEKSVS